jgi:hypothetical protein
MPSLNRRRFLRHTATATAAAALSPSLLRAANAASATGQLRLAPFRFDVTPPVGHSLCGGWIKPVETIDDPLEAIGFVLLGAGAPIVICAVDWTGILNASHLAFRSALAEAAGTTPDRVAVQCVHQHNALFVCAATAALVASKPELPAPFEPAFFKKCLDAARLAVTAALPRARPVTHVATGTARIEQVASNRRMARNAQGHVGKMRGSKCVDPELIALPEGPVDPLLRTVAFYDGAEKIVACHYYATHPMSYYGDGRVTSDFVGLARKQRQREEPACTHLYFTGCAGNIAAGKYNDGSPAARVRLTERIYRGIVAADATLRPVPLKKVSWRTSELFAQPHPALDPVALRRQLADRTALPVGRIVPAFRLALLERCAQRVPFLLSALHLDDIALLHLPAESFLEYQLHAQSLRPGRAVAVAAYGDGGPWYIPTRAEFPHGGYEVEVAFCAPDTETQMHAAIAQLLA